MASSKYERELRFIATETKRLDRELTKLRDVMPETPLDAEKKAMEIGNMEEKLGQLLSRKKEIEDSYIAVGLAVPDLNQSFNANGCRDIVTGDDYVAPQFEAPEPQKPVAETRPEFTNEELTDQIKSITDELMQIEIKMLQADIADASSEKQKLSMCASTLRSRREYLVGQMKALRTINEEVSPSDENEVDRKIADLQADTRALRSQISDVRTDVMDIKEQLRQILEALRLE